MIVLACAVFQIDAVMTPLIHFSFKYNLLKENIFAAIKTLRNHDHYPCNGFDFWTHNVVCVLLLRKIGDRELWQHGELFMRVRLAKPPCQRAEVFRYDDSKCSTTDLLSWI